MKKVRITQFHSGQSETEVNTTSYNSDMGNFDIYTDSGKLIPEGELTLATMAGGDISPYNITDFARIKFSSSYKNYGIGQYSAVDTRATLYGEDTEGVFSKKANSATGYIQNSLVVYNGLPHFLTSNGSQVLLNNFTSESTANNLATIATTTAQSIALFSNPIDNILYIAVNNVIYTWNGTTLYTGITAPATKLITSLCAYSSYLAIATKENIESGNNSMVYIWDRDRSLTTFTQLVDFGTGGLQVLENLNGLLFGVSYEDGYITTRAWSGGEAQILSSVKASNLLQLKRVFNHKLYFATRDNNSLWCLYKNKEGRYILTKHYFVYNGTTSSLIYGFNFLNNKLYINVLDDSTGKHNVMYRNTNILYTNTSYYITTANTGMDNDDLARMKTLKRVYVNFKNPNDYTSIFPIIKVYVSLDNSSYTQIIEDESDTGVYTIDTGKDMSGNVFENFKQIKIKVEVSQRYAEMLEIGYIYENTNHNNI